MGSKLLYTLPALLLALLALILALVGLSREQEPAAAEGKAPAPEVVAANEKPAHRYWVAREPLEAGQRLTEEKLAVVSADTPITGALSADQSVIGEPLRSSVRAGELLAEYHLKAGGSLPGSLSMGQRAIAIPVDNVIGAGGLLRPGDRVDVITAFRRSDKDAPVALVMLRRIEVLAVRGVMDNAAGDDNNSNRRNDTVVLSVPEERVSALMLASSEGKLRLAVVGGEDEDAASQPSPDQGPADDGQRATVVAANQSEDEAEPFYFDDFFPESPKAAPAPAAPRASPGRRVQVFEGAESRSTYVR